MAKDVQLFHVETSPTKEFVVDGITRDATNKECIFDLIDNSIDAARNSIFKGIPPKQRKELPDSYAGYQIDINLNGSGFKIADNCGGIPVQHFKDKVLRFGERSEHRMGIGAFGVGLNRALFRLGRTSRIKTDTGIEHSELVLNRDKYLRNSDVWQLPAHKSATTGHVGTTIEITELPTETARSFGDERWVRALQHEVGRRYGRFIQKGLKLWVDNLPIKNEEIKIRIDGVYDPRHKIYRTEDGVKIEIRYGQHELHHFPFEPGDNLEQNRRLTPQYGWTILCNDRAVIMSDRSDKTGWDVTKFHSEFYGFVGYVNFISESPDKLPWKTTKTDIDLNNPAYRVALDDMRRFAVEWRVEADRRKKAAAKGAALTPLPAKKPTPVVTRSAPKKSARAKPAPKPVTKIDHTQYREVLPQDINEINCVDKHLTLVHDAKTLDLVDHPYSGLALIRMLFETSAITHLDRHQHSEKVRQFAIDRRRQRGMKIEPEDEKNVSPSMDELLVYMQNNPSIWGTKANHLRHCVSKMSAHQKSMNSALHNAYQQISKNRVVEIRDEVVPLLRYLIEK